MSIDESKEHPGIPVPLNPDNGKALKAPLIFYGAWASIKAECLRKDSPEVFWDLVRNHELHQFLLPYQKRYEIIANQKLKELLRERGATKELYDRDLLSWILIVEGAMEEVREQLTSQIQGKKQAAPSPEQSSL